MKTEAKPRTRKQKAAPFDPAALPMWREFIKRNAPIRIYQERAEAPVLWTLFVDPRECGLERVRNDPFSNIPTISVDHRGAEGFLRVASLYVPERYRRMGFATALMNAVLQFQKERVNLPMYLDAMPYAQMVVTQEQLFEFYGRFGFARCPRHPDYAMVRAAAAVIGQGSTVNREE
jgi:GNAT superfamily N-acetyltransferase